MKNKTKCKVKVTGLKYMMLVMVEIKIPVDKQALWCPSRKWTILDGEGSKQGGRQYRKKTDITAGQNNFNH